MQGRDILVVGASYGGMKALCELCGGLEADMPAAIFVVWHTAAGVPSILPEVLNRSSPFRAAFAKAGEPIRNGRIYVAPPDQHLVLMGGAIHLTRGPRESRFRPAIDPLFCSAATTFGPRVIGIVLTGLLDDGTQGLWFIKRRGGVTIVQDPNEAEAASMPASAIAEGVVDHIEGLRDMPLLLFRLTAGSVTGKVFAEDGTTMEDNDDDRIEHLHPPGVTQPSTPLARPDWEGAIWETGGGSEPIRYRYHVGHQFSEQGVVAAKQDETELALWTALRALKENAALYGTMAQRAREGNRLRSAERFEQMRDEYREKAQIIRHAIETPPAPRDLHSPGQTDQAAFLRRIAVARGVSL